MIGHLAICLRRVAFRVSGAASDAFGDPAVALSRATLWGTPMPFDRGREVAADGEAIAAHVLARPCKAQRTLAGTLGTR